MGIRFQMITMSYVMGCATHMFFLLCKLRWVKIWERSLHVENKDQQDFMLMSTERTNIWRD